MKKKDFDKLEEGVYEVDFGDGVTTLAIIGNTIDNGNWIAPLNFNYPVAPGSVNHNLWIKRLTYVKLLVSESAYRIFRLNRRKTNNP